MILIEFENDDFLIVDKPPGLNFHSEQTAGLVVLVSQQVGCRLYPVHRLDKMTSGLLILAKSPKVAAELQSLFEHRQIEKYYVAISTHKPKKKQGWVKGDMVPARRGSWKLTKSHLNPAISKFVSHSTQPNERLFLFKIFTGKTHQIRVAMKSLGAPIAGDARYDQKLLAEQEDRGYLHAFMMRFEWQGKTLSIRCMPIQGKRFLNAETISQLQYWQNPWESMA